MSQHIALDIFGQSSSLSRLYTQLTFSFYLSEDTRSTRDQTYKMVRKALDQLGRSFPWLTGRTTFNSVSGYKITPEALGLIRSDLDYAESTPSMHEFAKAGFPFSMIHEDDFAPSKTLPSVHFDRGTEVFLTQLVFVKGGCFLTFAGQHNCMDIVGLVEAIRLFAKACQGLEYDEEDIEIGNLPRQNIIPLLHQTDMKQTETPTPAPNIQADSEPEVPSEWAYLSFSPTALSTLKQLATSSLSSGWISTDDTLSAFLWQQISLSRLRRLPPSTPTTFSRQVNTRPHLALPPHYTGTTVQTITTTHPLSDITTSPLGTTASRLRNTLQTTNLSHQARHAATTLTQHYHENGYGEDRPPPRKKLSSADVKMSSWANQPAYEFVFGELGRAEVVRRPGFGAWEGLVYLLPRGRDGGIVAGVSLRGEDMERLRGLEGVREWAEWIG